MPFKLNDVGNLNQAIMKTSKIWTEKPVAGQSCEGSKFVLLWLKLLVSTLIQAWDSASNAQEKYTSDGRIATL